MTASVPGFTTLTGGTNIGDLGAGSDATITNPISIGFNFVFDGVTYSQFQISDNGFIHLGNNLTGTGYGNAGGDVVIPNDFNNANTLRPFIAPLWEDLAMANSGGKASYKVTGSAPNRTLTIEWTKVSWRFSTGTDQLSFQLILYETTNIIDFVYKVGAVAMGTLPTGSIGLGGTGNGNYYSLNNSGSSPTAGFGINTTSINTRPADGQRYRWTPASVLPIELISFTGINKLQGNLLEWKTASETNNDFFTVERSSDATHFETIATIKGSGTNHTDMAYTYLDTELSNTDAILYYRIKQTDINLHATYTEIISIYTSEVHKPPLLYYDRTSDNLYIEGSFSDAGNYQLEIIDLSGKIVGQYSFEIVSKERYFKKNFLSFQLEGIFIARISDPTGNGLVQTKFMK